MPIYTYRCENCGVQFEERQKFSDDPLKVCPECDHEALRKVYMPVGIVFKGSGFYATDNRSPSGAKRAKKESEAEKKSESESSSSETKSDKKTETKSSEKSN
jgi:putative FmdB family regulatory protein